MLYLVRWGVVKMKILRLSDRAIFYMSLTYTAPTVSGMLEGTHEDTGCDLGSGRRIRAEEMVSFQAHPLLLPPFAKDTSPPHPHLHSVGEFGQQVGGEMRARNHRQTWRREC